MTRVKLKRGKQRRLLLWFKSKSNISWVQLARQLGVTTSTLKNWKNEKTLIPLSLLNKLDKNKKFSCYILELKEENWGRAKGGINSRGNPKKITIPSKDEKLAELIGIILGDGHINSYRKGKKIATHKVVIAGNSNKDLIYLKSFVAPLLKELFGIMPRFYQSKRSNCYYVLAHSFELVKFLFGMGLKPGNKIKNKTTFPRWIWGDDKFIKACLRGLYDTDGCLYELRTHWPGTFQLNFENHNESLLKSVEKALIRLGIKSSKIHNHRIVITRKEALHKFYKSIGTNNPRLNKKFIELYSPVV